MNYNVNTEELLDHKKAFISVGEHPVQRMRERFDWVGGDFRNIQGLLVGLVRHSTVVGMNSLGHVFRKAQNHSTGDEVYLVTFDSHKGFIYLRTVLTTEQAQKCMENSEQKDRRLEREEVT